MAGRGGPNTKAGKAAVSRNALKHCLTSNAPVIPEMEAEEEWQEHLDGFVADFAPEGYVEKFLVERYASLLWRLRRATRHEVHCIILNIMSVPAHMDMAENLYVSRNPDDFTDPDPDEVEARMHNTVLPSEFEMNRTSRYEAHLQRQAVHTLRQLLVLQARRRGDPMYFPRFALTGSADTRDPVVGKPVPEPPRERERRDP